MLATDKSTKSKIKRAHGTSEWSVKTINCCTGCSHDCLYCYAKEMGNHFSTWSRFVVNMDTMTWKRGVSLRNRLAGAWNVSASFWVDNDGVFEGNCSLEEDRASGVLGFCESNSKRLAIPYGLVPNRKNSFRATSMFAQVRNLRVDSSMRPIVPSVSS